MKKYEASELFKDFEALIRSTIIISNEITLKAGKTKPWESKLGGCPYLEDIKNYPFSSSGKPMMFFAQVNLADITAIDDMPESGLLQFYVNSDDMYGYAEPCKVIYIENFTTDENLLLDKNPYEKSFKDFLPFNKEGRMTFETREMPISTSCERYNKLFGNVTMTEEQNEKLFDELYAPGSRVGGYPYFVQSEPEFYEQCNVLLLQLDIDDECGIMFGDAGNCNFFISREDLKKRDFSNVTYDWQCC